MLTFFVSSDFRSSHKKIILVSSDFRSSHKSKTYHKTLDNDESNVLLIFENADRMSAKYSYLHVKQPSKKNCNFMVSHTLLSPPETVSSTSTLVTEEPLALFSVWACALSKHFKANDALRLCSFSQDLNQQQDYLAAQDKVTRDSLFFFQDHQGWLRMFFFFTSQLHVPDCLSCGFFSW